MSVSRKRTVILVLSIFVILSGTVYARVSKLGPKVKMTSKSAVLKSKPRSPAITGHTDAERISLPKIDLQAVRENDKKRAGNEKVGFRIGLRRKLNTTIQCRNEKSDQKKKWSKSGSSGSVWTTSIAVPEAKAIRVHISNIDIPKGAEIFAYSAKDPSKYSGPYDNDYLKNRKSFWTGSVFAEKVIIEIHAPSADVQQNISLDIDEVIHVYKDLTELTQKVGFCHNDAEDYSEWSDETAAVAGLGSVGYDGYLWCTGTLINDTDSTDGTDYFMTAYHCVGSQSDADDVEFYWFYDSSSDNPSAVTRTGGGADFLAGIDDDSGNDFSFLRLREEPPVGAVYAGWRSLGAADTGDSITCIHHPDGSYKRISFGSITSEDTNFYYVRWSSGVTEPGSSGSPIFDDNHYFQGQLWGGSSSCAFQQGIDIYGRFDVTYDNIKDWLNPPDTGTDTTTNTTGDTSGEIILLPVEQEEEVVPPPEITGFGNTGDYYGNGSSDLVIYDTLTGNWSISTVSGYEFVDDKLWGWAGAVPVAGDYDGDGGGDLAVFDDVNGLWYIMTVSGSLITWAKPWGWSGAVPVPGDYDGDGTDDLALFDSSNGYWFILSVDEELIAWAEQWGWTDALPVPGDYDGDGKDDLAVFDSSSGYWFIRTLSGDVITWAKPWGWSGAVPVPGDYDGDGKHDLAVFDDAGGAWYVSSLTDVAIIWGISWGWDGAIPVSGDFDGDGISDLAVFDDQTGNWYIRNPAGSILLWAYDYAIAGEEPVSR